MDSRRGLGQKEVLDEESPPPELRAHPGAVRKIPETEGQVHQSGNFREQRKNGRQNPRRDHPRQGLQEILQGPAYKTIPDRNRSHRQEHRLAQRRPYKTQGDAQAENTRKEERLMTQKLWNKCKKCGCDKPEDTEKLCEQCKANRKQFWSDVKKVGGVAAGALLVVIAGGKMRKR